ncbi:unnamed protein product [Phaeothamnion confervicola]
MAAPLQLAVKRAAACLCSVSGAASRPRVPSAAALRPRKGVLRPISCTTVAQHGHDDDDHDGLSVRIKWKDKTERIREVDAPVGMNLMRVAHKHGIELEGACEGVCACSTCHVILDEYTYGSLPEPSEDEEDMLDQAFGLTATSRLGCQVIVAEEMDGITVQLPAATRNFYVDGHVPQPH